MASLTIQSASIRLNQLHTEMDQQLRARTTGSIHHGKFMLLRKKVGHVMHMRISVQLTIAGTVAAKYITRRPIAKQGSSLSIDKLMQLVSDCTKKHARCKLGVDGLNLDDFPVLPTRVIDVGKSDQLPHLAVPHSQRDKYVTLSHCWGANRWVATTIDTLPHMRDGFDLESIRQSYADAILICRRLGIQYLWIDSFCIVQDDRNDWEAESAKMGEIYERAYCNIAATGVDDGTAGFLKNRLTEPIFIRVENADDENRFYFTDQPDSNFEAQVHGKRLNTRGWVLQERLLSRRTIHFSDDMWYFECGEHVISEDGWQHDTERVTSQVTPSLRASLEDTTMAIGKVFRPNDANVQDDVPAAYTEVLWAQILRAYSKCGLTFWSDKRPALQGLVSRFDHLTKVSYHSGHWVGAGEAMPLSLMWYAKQDGGLTFEADQRAPNWSGLRGNGPIGFHDCRGATPTTRMDRVSEDGSTITLRGRLRDAKLAMPNGENPGAKPTYYSMSFMNKTQYGTFSNTLGPARFDKADDIPKDFTLLLTFERVPPGRAYVNTQKDQLALILREASTAERNTGGSLSLEHLSLESGLKVYKRIGIANVNNHLFFSEMPFSKITLA